MPLLQFEGSSPKGEDSGNNFEVNSLSIDVFCKDFGSFKNRDVLLHFCSIKGLHICIRIMFRL